VVVTLPTRSSTGRARRFALNLTLPGHTLKRNQFCRVWILGPVAKAPSKSFRSACSLPARRCSRVSDIIPDDMVVDCPRVSRVIRDMRADVNACLRGAARPTYRSSTMRRTRFGWEMGRGLLPLVMLLRVSTERSGITSHASVVIVRCINGHSKNWKIHLPFTRYTEKNVKTCHLLRSSGSPSAELRYSALFQV
jgi:hypothetical protein